MRRSGLQENSPAIFHFGLDFYLRANLLTRSVMIIIQVNSIGCLFKRLPEIMDWEPNRKNFVKWTIRPDRLNRPDRLDRPERVKKWMEWCFPKQMRLHKFKNNLSLHILSTQSILFLIPLNYIVLPPFALICQTPLICSSKARCHFIVKNRINFVWFRRLNPES